MTYEKDPARWTASPDEAPELLRGAFSAAQNEGPSQTQMRALALKIAAVSAGGAVAIGATKATATANMAATAATWSIGKLAAVLAVAGGLATGVVAWQKGSAPEHDARTVTSSAKETAAPVAAPTSAQPASPATSSAVSPSQQRVAPTTDGTAGALGASATSAPAASAQLREQPSAAPQVDSTATARAVDSASSARASSLEPAAAADARTTASSGASGKRSGERAGTRTSPQPNSSASRHTSTAAVAGSSSAKVTEVELLRRAQGALRARPREAYRLTEQHRQLYPTGEFAQERDALAIQALIGAGETALARDLAVSFIKAHPTSPHAHRFREAMGIR